MALQINDVKTSPVTLEIGCQWDVSYHDYPFKYRVRVQISYGNYGGQSQNFYGKQFTQQNAAILKDTIIIRGNSLIKPGEQLSCYAVVEYINTASETTYSASQQTNSWTTVMPSAYIDASANSITSASAKIRVGLKTDCYYGEAYYRAQVFNEAGNSVIGTSNPQKIYSTGNSYAYFNDIEISGLNANTSYELPVNIRWGKTTSELDSTSTSDYIISGTVSFKTSQQTNQIIFNYSNFTYVTQSDTLNSPHTISVNYNFSHISPSDGTYKYWLRYWYYDVTAGQSTGPQRETAILLTEIASKHTSRQSHTLSIQIPVLPNHTINVRAQLWQQKNSETAEAVLWAPSLSQNPTSITVKGVGGYYRIADVQLDISNTSAPRLYWNFQTNDFGETGAQCYYRGRVRVKINSPSEIWYTRETQRYHFTSSPRSYNVALPYLDLSSGIEIFYQITMYQIIFTDSDQEDLETQVAYKEGSVIVGGQALNLLKWSWTDESGSWNHQQSTLTPAADRVTYLSNAKKALDNKEVTTNFSYTIWNDLINWVTYNLDQLDESYSSDDVTDAKMTNVSSDRILTADRYNNFKDLFNKLHKALGNPSNLMNFDVESEVSQVKANDYFKIVVSSLNASIDDYEE